MAGRTQKTVPWVALVIAVAAPFFSWLEAREARMQVRESRTDGSAGYHLLLREVDQLHQRLDALEGREPTVAIETSGNTSTSAASTTSRSAALPLPLLDGFEARHDLVHRLAGRSRSQRASFRRPEGGPADESFDVRSRLVVGRHAPFYVEPIRKCLAQNRFSSVDSSGEQP
jgi:hypothetical protein